MEHALASFLAKFTYLAIVGVLSAAGLGVPISEDLTLLLGGGLAAQGVTFRDHMRERRAVLPFESLEQGEPFLNLLQPRWRRFDAIGVPP